MSMMADILGNSSYDVSKATKKLGDVLFPVSGGSGGAGVYFDLMVFKGC